MNITWSCPRCITTHSSNLVDGGNQLICPQCKWTWYLKMLCYETQRKHNVKIEEHEHETKLVPISSADKG